MQVLDIVDAAEADTGSSLLQLEVVMPNTCTVVVGMASNAVRDTSRTGTP